MARKRRAAAGPARFLGATHDEWLDFLAADPPGERGRFVWWDWGLVADIGRDPAVRDRYRALLGDGRGWAPPALRRALSAAGNAWTEGPSPIWQDGADVLIAWESPALVIPATDTGRVLAHLMIHSPPECAWSDPDGNPVFRARTETVDGALQTEYTLYPIGPGGMGPVVRRAAATAPAGPLAEWFRAMLGAQEYGD